MIEDNLEMPFETTVLGVMVTVNGITQTESGIIADCARDGQHQAISVLDLPLPVPPPKGAEWIAAYRHWAGRSNLAAGDLRLLYFAWPAGSPVAAKTKSTP